MPGTFNPRPDFGTVYDRQRASDAIRAAGLELEERRVRLAEDNAAANQQLNLLQEARAKRRQTIDDQRYEEQVKQNSEAAEMLPLLRGISPEDPLFDHRVAELESKFRYGARDPVIRSMIGGNGGLMEERAKALSAKQRYVDAYGVNPHDYLTYDDDGRAKGVDWGMVHSVIRRQNEDAQKAAISNPALTDVALTLDPVKGAERITAKVRPAAEDQINAAVAKNFLSKEQAEKLATADPKTVAREIALGEAERTNDAEYRRMVIEKGQSAQQILRSIPEDKAALDPNLKAQRLSALEDLMDVSQRQAALLEKKPAASAPAAEDPRRALAQKALDDPNASEAHKAAARKILGIQ